MGQYRKILLIVDPSGEESPAYTRAVVLAKRSGAMLMLGLFHERPARTAPAWLQERILHLKNQGILARRYLTVGVPLHKAIVESVMQLQPDLVVKDRGDASVLKRISGASLDAQLVRLCPAPLLLVNPSAQPLPKRIIAAVDVVSGDERRAVNERILKTSLELALQCDAQVSMAYAFDFLPLTPVPDASIVYGGTSYRAIEEVRDERREELFKFAEAHSVPDDRRYFLDGAPETALAHLAADQRADVVTMGTNYRTGLDRLVFGSTAARLLHRLPCDLFVVKPEGFEADLAANLGDTADTRWHATA